MHKKKNTKRNKSNKVSNILSALPLHYKLHEQLSSSQQTIMILQSSWHEWCAKHLGNELSKGCELTNVNNNVLHIECQSVTAATKLKHLNQTLLLFFQETIERNTKGTKQKLIEKITIAHRPENKPKHTSESKPKIKRAVTTSAIESIEYCQKSSKNVELQEALKRLHNTLKHHKN